MRLVEVIAGIDSSPEALDVARADRRGDGQGGHRRRGRARLPGQPLQPAVRPRGAEAACRSAWPTSRRSTAIVRARRRLSDGAVRAAGPRRDRRRLRGLAVLPRAQLRRAALAAVAAERADGRGRPPGPQDRPRLVRLRRRRAAPAEDPEPAAARRRRGPARRRRRRGRRRRRAARRSRPSARLRRARPGRGRGRRAVAARRLPAPTPRAPPLQGGPVALLCADGSLHGARRRRRRRRASTRCRRWTGAPLVELTRAADGTARAGRRARRGVLRGRSGCARAWVGDAPGLVLGRHRVPARQRGVRSPSARASARARTSTRHGARPQPPARAARVGRRDRRSSTCSPSSTALRDELGEERYRAAPLLRRLAT